jgi:hypothetical protein
MTGRPCKPDDDLKGLWRTLLGTPFPACGIAEEADAADGDSVASERGKNQKAASDTDAAILENNA